MDFSRLASLSRSRLRQLLFWKNLRGIKPAITPANQDIAQIIEDQTRQEIVGNPNQIPFPLTLPEDFEISIFAENFSKPRVIKQDPSGILLVSDIEAGQIIALPDKNQDGQADSHQLVIDNLNQPHGIEFLAFDEGYKLYVATTDAVISYDYDEKNQNASNPVKIAALPSDDGHYTRAIQKTTVNGKSKLLVSVGSSCNVCQENDERRAAILVMNPDGSSQEVYAKGLRNSVFLANRNGTDEVWATENSRDLLGDNLPPDEINIIEGGETMVGRFVMEIMSTIQALTITRPILALKAKQLPLTLTSKPIQPHWA